MKFVKSKSIQLPASSPACLVGRANSRIQAFYDSVNAYNLELIIAGKKVKER
jgi:hypothetical protein